MAKGRAIVNEREVMADVTATVTVLYKRDWRVRFGLWLLWVAAWIAGFHIRVED